MSKIVTLNDSMVGGLLSNPTAIAQLPGVKSTAKQINRMSKGCRCGGSRAKTYSRAITNLKTMMVAWPAEAKAMLKKLLGADEIQVYVGKKLVKF